MAELLLEAHHRHETQRNARTDADADAHAGAGGAGGDAAAWLKQPRSLRQQYPANMTVDFTKLRANALRRYMAYHGIQEIPGSSKEQLAIVVARHFNEECKLTDEETSIASFLSYIKGARVEAGNSSDSVVSEPAHEDDAYAHNDKENTVDLTNMDMMPGDDYENDQESQSSSDDSGDDDMDQDGDTSKSPTVKRVRPHGSSSHKHRHDPTSKSPSSSSSSHKGGNSKKKRKTRLYCVCKGSSFGNMIACDNRKCLDRSNWYHMACVDLEPTEDPPETWYCPNCVERDAADVPENQYRKPVASVTYGDMISHALTALPSGKGSFKDICDFVEKQYESQLNWKLESDQRKSPVWKSSVRKILFSNVRFRKHPDDKGVFTLAA